MEAGAETATCDLTQGPKDEPCVLDEAYGVFVASNGRGATEDGSADASAPSVSGDGSKAQPFATIGLALAHLGGKTRIYVCNGLYAEQVSISVPVSLYGGLSCAPGSAGRAWGYIGGIAEVSSPSASYALSISGVSSGAVTVEDVSFASPSATAAGGSSIGALVSSCTVSLARVTISAGSGANGAPGADGTATPNYTGAAPSGGSQVSTMDDAGVAVPLAAGAGAVNHCALSGTSTGGDGGLGCDQYGVGSAGSASPAAPVTAPGRDGQPMGVTVPGDGGAPVMITTNDPGADGVAGQGGAAMPAYGTLSPSGWTPSGGGDGAPGSPGQGGAGATDPRYGGRGIPAVGISLGGGGGGAGGCGGAGGKGGGGGGASIAVAAVDATIELTDCILTAAAAGTGGAGGAGQDGQAGAQGGDLGVDPIDLHARGAAGGNGAGGSGGAGGTGGISVGILSKGSTITTNASTAANVRVGAAGAGGAAGAAGRHSSGLLSTGIDGSPGASGAAGTAAARLDLP